MLLVRFFSLGLLASPILAYPLTDSTAISSTDAVERDLALHVIKDVIEAVVNKAGSLNQAVQAFNGDINQATPILDGAAQLQTTITQGINTIRGERSLLLAGVLLLLPDVQNLNTAVEDVSRTIVLKKPVFDQAQLSPIVLQQLREQQTAAQGLVDALITKLPPYLPDALGEILSAPGLAALAFAVRVYS